MFYYTPASPSSPTSHMVPLARTTALCAMEAGLRRALADHCTEHLFTLFTYFTSSEEEEFMRGRLFSSERESRNLLKLEELEDVERTMRFDILFDCEVDWETLTGRLGAESFSLVTRTVLEGMETRQFIRLALELADEREYVHRCEIMADGLRPGFIRDQKKLINEAVQQLCAIQTDEFMTREEMTRDAIERMPLLASFELQRQQVTELELLTRVWTIEEPFERWVAITKKIRDEFAFFWVSRVIEFHMFLAQDEERLYSGVLIQEEDVTRQLCLIPAVVGGLERVWRGDDVVAEEREAWHSIEIQALVSLETATRISVVEHEERCVLQNLLWQVEHSRVLRGELYPQWQAGWDDLYETLKQLFYIGRVSQRFALEIVGIGARRGIVLQWVDKVFATATAALVQREHITRIEEELPIEDECSLFQIEAEELHSRHSTVLYPQLDSVFKVFCRAGVNEETTARNYIIDVEWENGIVGLYSSFHLLWLETVTMGVTRNQLRREWEREMVCMYEVWVRLGIANNHAHELEMQVGNQIIEFMPDFVTEALPPEEDFVDGEEESASADAAAAATAALRKSPSGAAASSAAAAAARRRKLRAKDPDALPDTFYIGEDPFAAAEQANNNSSNNNQKKKPKHTPAPPPPPPESPLAMMTPGVVIRYRAAPRRNQQMQSSQLGGTLSTLFGGSTSATKASSLFSSPTLNAAQGSHFILPDSIDVTSIRATIKELSRIRGGTFLLLAQFFQITRRRALNSDYDAWLASYGDMGYWAHAIEVGLLDQLTSLDDKLDEEIIRAQRRAIAHNSLGASEADRQLAAFVHDRSGRIDNNSPSRQQQHGSVSRGGSPSAASVSATRSTSRSPPKRRRTVIDALKESLRQPPRPSLRKLKPIPLTYHPDMMAPPPKANFSEWSPSRMTPDEFALLEHTMMLRASGVEANQTKEKLEKQQQQNHGKTTALPLEKGRDPAWNIYVAAASRNSHREHVNELRRQQQGSRNSSNRETPQSMQQQSQSQNQNGSFLSVGADSNGATGRSSRVRFTDEEQQLQQTQQQQQRGPSTSRPGSRTGEIPRLAPSRLDDEAGAFGLVVPPQQRPSSAALAHRYQRKNSPPSSSAAAVNTTYAFGTSYSAPRRYPHAYGAGTTGDPNVEDRRLKFSDLTSDGAAAATANGGGAAAVADKKNNKTDPHLLHQYAKVVQRTQHVQSAMGSSTAEFIAHSMRPINLVVKPAPPKYVGRRL